jgi:molybdopterin-guanine dinucleotide biosynthesis protein A
MHKVFPMGGFVLVGGQSQRMGRDKALLELQGQPLFLRTVELLRPHVAEVTLLGPPARYARFGIAVLPDRYPGRGPLAALCTGLESSPYEWNVFLACDLPFLEPRFLDFLLGLALGSDFEAVVPQPDAGWQPLCAAYHRRCLPVMQQSLERANAGIVDALPSLRVDALGPDTLGEFSTCLQMFKNVNTPEEWEEVQRELRAAAPAAKTSD